MGKKTNGKKNTGNGKTDPAKGKPKTALGGGAKVQDQASPFVTRVINPGKCA